MYSTRVCCSDVEAMIIAPSAGRVSSHLLAFGLGGLALWLLGRGSSAAADDADTDDSEEDEEEEDNPRGLRPSAHPVRDDFEAAEDEPYKMLLICNMELYKESTKTGERKAVKMSAGKAAAQCSHATLGAYRRGMRLCPRLVRDWLEIGQMKITVKCPTVQELLDVQEKCAAAGLNHYLIRDAGHTEIEPGSRTVLAIGPAPASAIDPHTRHLKPY